MKSIKSIILTVAFVSGLLSGCSVFEKKIEKEIIFEPQIADPVSLIVDGNLVPKQTIDVVSLISEQIDVFLVKEGDNVNKGDVILKMKGVEGLQTKISSAELEILQAKTELADLERVSKLDFNHANFNLSQAEIDLIEAQEFYKPFENDDYQKKIDDAKVEVNNLEDDLSDANDGLDSYKDLDEDNSLRINAENKVSDLEERLEDSIRKRDRLIFEKENAQSRVLTAEESVKEARYLTDQKLDGVDKTKLELVQAQLAKAQADYDAAQKSLDHFEIQAPFTGKIMHTFVDSGDTVIASQPLFTIADTSDWFVETSDVTELDISQVLIGEEVRLKADAYPEIDYSGKVEKISDWFYEKGGEIHYQVRILLLNPDPFLRWGMTFEVTFP